MARPSPPSVDRQALVRLWFQRQGLTRPRGAEKLTRKSFASHLERTGALQLDSVNVIDRAHYLTLWSRFGHYERKRVDRWTYRDRAAYEYWGHEASILPISHLPHGRRRMRRFPGNWNTKSWWPRFDTPAASKRRVLRRLRDEGPLESVDFERQPHESETKQTPGGSIALPKEDKRSLRLLWHGGRVAVAERRHFRCVYDLAEQVYPDVQPTTMAAYEDGWLLGGLSGNGIASERHLLNYLTAPELDAKSRKRVIERNLKSGNIMEVRVEGERGPCYALPEHMEALSELPEPEGTNLLCPFDSFLWQRQRAEDLLGFKYRIEIYVPPAKREYGYYVLPILHDGRLVGRLDPKLHRDRELLEIRSLHLEPGFKDDRKFRSGLRDSLESLAGFLGAKDLALPRAWKNKLR